VAGPILASVKVLCYKRYAMSNHLRRTLGRTSFRALYSLAAGALFGAWGAWRGWPWWVALPAGILVTTAVFMALVSVLYAYTKISYPARAEAIRAKTNRPAMARPETSPQASQAGEASPHVPGKQGQEQEDGRADSEGLGRGPIE
jgi:hypothetical protein